MQGLLVQAGGQGLVIPLAHIDFIDYKHQEKYTHLYYLASLLSFSLAPASPVTSLPPLILLAGSHRRGAGPIYEILCGVEMVMKHLAAHPPRPGIICKTFRVGREVRVDFLHVPPVLYC